VSIDKDIAILEQVPMLRALGRSALRMIAMGAETRELQPGDVLFLPGQKIDSAYLVQDGVFQLSADPARSGKVIEVGAGTLLGEFALLAETAQPLIATAVDQAVVIRISRSMFLRILEDDVGAAIRLRDYVAQRARAAIADVLDVRYTLDPEDR
jgi:CRP-like cAMP-binding protein